MYLVMLTLVICSRWLATHPNPLKHRSHALERSYKSMSLRQVAGKKVYLATCHTGQLNNEIKIVENGRRQDSWHQPPLSLT